MKNVGWLFLAILIAYGCAVVAPLLRYRLRGRACAFAGWCIVPIILVCPLLIPAANVGLRTVSVFASADITFRMVEYFLRLGQSGAEHSPSRLLPLLDPVPGTLRRLSRSQLWLLVPESPWPQVLRLFGGIVGFTIAFLAVRALSSIALLRSSFSC